MTARLTPRRANLAKIHLAKKTLCLDDETYRQVLQRVCGRDSAREIDDAGHLKLLAEFRRLGWKPTARPTRRPGMKTPQQRKLRLLWLRLIEAGAVRSVEESALLHFVKNRTGVERLEWLTVEQASALIEILKNWARRVGADVT
jgi:phage gp16-like protein